MVRSSRSLLPLYTTTAAAAADASARSITRRRTHAHPSSDHIAMTTIIIIVIHASAPPAPCGRHPRPPTHARARDSLFAAFRCRTNERTNERRPTTTTRLCSRRRLRGFTASVLSPPRHRVRFITLALALSPPSLSPSLGGARIFSCTGARRRLRPRASSCRRRTVGIYIYIYLFGLFFFFSSLPFLLSRRNSKPTRPPARQPPPPPPRRVGR